MIIATAAACYLWLQTVLPCAATVPAIEHDPFSGAVEVLHYDFENEDDKDFDKQPDGWTRRTGPNYPSYVKTAIDRNLGFHEKQSLRMHVNGGDVTTYSDVVRIDALHSYVFRGRVRTQMLKNNAAILSISFLNQKRQRVQRFLSEPVTGTWQGWHEVKIGPMAPHEDVKFVVIGCHLAHGKKMDIRGSVWFDDLWLGSLPQLSLLSNFETHFQKQNQNVQITSKVSGLNPKHSYKLHMEILDAQDQVIQNQDFELETIKPKDNTEAKENSADVKPIQWELNPQKYGFYRVRSTLIRNNRVTIQAKETSFAVMDFAEEVEDGEFGWTISKRIRKELIPDVENISAQAGINWLKISLWQTVYEEDQQIASRLTALFDQIQFRGITPIGLLNIPPSDLRRKFAKDWLGISEIFTMHPSFWSPTLEPVMTRYSSNVRHWQLGSEVDESFVGLRSLPETLSIVKQELDRLGRDTQIGLHWNWNTPIPSRTQIPHGFLSISNPEPLKGPELIEKLTESAGSGMPRWVLLKPLARSKHSLEERGSDLVKRMVAAKIGDAEGIFAYNVFDPEHGLLNENGSPTRLFLPWRTVALALRNAKYMGSLTLPNNSTNHVFFRNGKAIMVVWNEEPVTEELFLGENVSEVDVWGMKKSVPRNRTTSRQTLKVGPNPIILLGCSEPIARWRMAVQFKKGKLASRIDEQEETILGVNTFALGLNGKVTLNLPKEKNGKPKNWEIDPGNGWQLQLAANEQFKLPMQLTLPPNTSLGEERLSIDFEISADRLYKFRVYRPYEIGLGDVGLQVKDYKDENGNLIVEQIITNTLDDEILNFQCNLFVPGDRRHQLVVTKLGNGPDTRFYIIPNADRLRGEELWLRAEQTDGQRILNYRWTVGLEWDLIDNEKGDPLTRPKPTKPGNSRVPNGNRKNRLQLKPASAGLNKKSIGRIPKN